MRTAVLLLIVALCVHFFGAAPGALTAATRGEELRSVFDEVFKARTRGLLEGREQALEALYDRSSDSGEWALEHEIGRVKYFSEWVIRRNIVLGPVETLLSVVDSGSSDGKAWGSLCHNMVIGYRHQQSEVVCRLGVRTIHWMELAREGDRWLIRKDWFWDPLGSSLFPRIPVSPVSDSSALEHETARRGGYDRGAAVRYADRYSGVRIGDSDGRYNPKYRDFTGAGGDCANFASQVLTDGAAGGLPRDGAWFYRDGKGTDAWLRADFFVDHLLDTGLGTLVARGRYTSVAPVVGRLEAGDIIAYERRGLVEHVSVVVGTDACGYTCVNSHTADRFHVPWDLGLEEGSVVWLIHIAA